MTDASEPGHSLRGLICSACEQPVPCPTITARLRELGLDEDLGPTPMPGVPGFPTPDRPPLAPPAPAPTGRDYRASDDPAWQPYRDPDTGQPVTLTAGQCAAVLRAFEIYASVIRAEAAKGENPQPAFNPDAAFALRTVTKSCLMGRLLHAGLPPLVDAPPVEYAAPDYTVEVPR